MLGEINRRDNKMENMSFLNERRKDMLKQEKLQLGDKEKTFIQFTGTDFKIDADAHTFSSMHINQQTQL